MLPIRCWTRALLLGVLCWTTLAHAQKSTDPMPRQQLRLLTIGNSFSNDATFFLEKIAAADGRQLTLKTASVGGSPLQLHWDRAELHEKNPQDPKGTYTGGRGLKEILSDGTYDYVTIQQASIKSHDLATYRPYAAKLQQYVSRYAPSAELLLHETWAYRMDDPRFAVAKPKPGEPRTQQEMYDGLSTAYRTIAGELGVRVIPVGDAFYAADHDTEFAYKPDPSFDPKTAQQPALPAQQFSLHVGRTWKKAMNGTWGLAMDGHHSSMAGRYLGACVWYETLFNTSCVGNKFEPPGLDEKHRRFLQETAHRTVVKERATALLKQPTATTVSP